MGFGVITWTSCQSRHVGIKNFHFELFPSLHPPSLMTVPKLLSPWLPAIFFLNQMKTSQSLSFLLNCEHGYTFTLWSRWWQYNYMISSIASILSPLLIFLSYHFLTPSFTFSIILCVFHGSLFYFLYSHILSTSSVFLLSYPFLKHPQPGSTCLSAFSASTFGLLMLLMKSPTIVQRAWSPVKFSNSSQASFYVSQSVLSPILHSS